jgi:hypothetical protein
LRDELEKANSNYSELLKLRGEIGVLRRQAGQISQIKSQKAAQAMSAIQPVDLLEQQKQAVGGKAVDAHIYLAAFMDYANSHDGQFPTNWDQIRDKYANAFPNGSGTNDFEIIQQAPINYSKLGADIGSVALIREFLAWPTVDGKWGKVYGFADGHSEPVFLPDGDFTTWEKAHTVPIIDGNK